MKRYYKLTLSYRRCLRSMKSNAILPSSLCDEQKKKKNLRREIQQGNPSQVLLPLPLIGSSN